MSDPEAKRRKGDGEDGDPEGLGQESEDPEVTKALESMQDIQTQLDKVNDEASDRVLAVEQEYNKKRRPIYANRNAIISTVPRFWQRCLALHPGLANLLTQEDVDVLAFISELDVEDFDDIKSGFRVVLKLAPGNPFIENEVLTKEYHYGDDGSVKVTPAEISWREGHAPAAPSLGGKRRKGPSYTFFLWLASADVDPAGATPDQIAEALKEEIWPNPLKYYNTDEADLGEDELALDEDGLEEGGYLVEGEDQEEVYDDEGEEDEGDLGAELLGEGEDEVEGVEQPRYSFEEADYADTADEAAMSPM